MLSTCALLKRSRHPASCAFKTLGRQCSRRLSSDGKKVVVTQSSSSGPPRSDGGVSVSNDDPHHHGEFRAEALQLYRDCLRLARGFPLSDPSDGVPWRVKLAKSARDEFEAARDEVNKYEVSRMILTGQAAIAEMKKKIIEANDSANKPP